ncbi:Tail completion protein [uncultured Caudovirales phage]|uniref:Tail completion protein n=1 Tax=uncultured Caudovirales phage TaxID=2100421 RepID=A0A6J5NK92_9CAUD|nr:Tail completion protein [uncultured Caudovirales phage]
MATAFTTASQELVFTALSGALTGCTVFDTAPFLPEGAPATTFPYCVIGNDTSVPWETDDMRGAEITLTLHFWSRANGFKQVKALMDQAYGILNRATLTKTGYSIIDCLFEFSEALDDPDGQTKHGIQRYRLTIREA